MTSASPSSYPVQFHHHSGGMEGHRLQSSEEEPVYVNAKQYARILKRRAARAKLETEGRIPKQRRVRVKEFITRDLWNSRSTSTSRGTDTRCNAQGERAGSSRTARCSTRTRSIRQVPQPLKMKKLRRESRRWNLKTMAPPQRSRSSRTSERRPVELKLGH